MRQSKVVERVSQRLLVAAVADPSERVRTAVLRALHSTTALDDYMAQVRSLLAKRLELWRHDLRRCPGDLSLLKIVCN